MTRALLRILGIDPGLNRTGWGVIETDGVRVRWIEHGVIRVPAGELPQRLHVILEQLALVIRTTQPQCASVERVFVNVNPQATLLLGQARGAAICAAVHAGLAVREHTALQVKQAVVGYGKADKLQVQTMVQKLLALPIAPPSDAADALACAICDAHTHAAFATGARATLPAAAARRASSGRQRRARAAWRTVAEKL